MPRYSEQPSVAFPNVWDWIAGLPPPSEWKSDSMFLKLCNGSQVPLLLSAKKSSVSPSFFLSLLVDFPFPISLWTSEALEPLGHGDHDGTKGLYSLFLNFIDGILHYGVEEKPMRRLSSRIDSKEVMADSKRFKGMFNCAFLCMALCVCVYEAPAEIRPRCLEVLERELEGSHRRSGGAVFCKQLLEAVGSNIEERMMRSMALAITNRMFNAMAAAADDPARNLEWARSIRSPLYHSYSRCANGLWKVRVYSPVPAMKAHDKHPATVPKDDRLLFALRYLHLEAVLQLSYALVFTADWIDVRVTVDNVRCDVVPLAAEAVLEVHGVAEEKHFPSRISVRISPRKESNVMSISLNQSSNNPSYEISNETSVDTGFEVPGKYSLMVSATEGSTTSLKPWKMEQSVRGNEGDYDWVLYDSQSGKEVAASRPSMIEMLQAKAWFKDRYSSAFRPFTKQGGVVFARDEYSQCISWKVKREMEGQTLVWEIAGSIWLTYWPNKYKSFYCETRRLDFSEDVELSLVR